MEFAEYTEYKKSGVTWFELIPAHWNAQKIKFSFKSKGAAIKTGPFGTQLKSEDMLGSDIKVYNQKNVIRSDLSLGGEYIDFDKFEKLKAFEVFDEDLLITTRGTIGRCKFVPIGSERGILHPCLMRIQLNSNSVNHRYFEFLLEESKLLLIELSLKSNSTTLEVIYSDTLKNIYAPIPPIKEQTQIAKFLDYKTAQIDRLIEKKKQLLEKLGEQRIATITQAVTKGLNPAAPMKDSGVAWLGEVPAHWEVISIKRLTPIRRGASPRPIQDPKYFDDEGKYSWVRIADVTANDHYLLNTTQTLSELGQSLSVPLEPGSLFLSIAGSVGKPMITKIKCCIHDGFVYFPYFEQEPEFLYYLFYSGQPYLGLGKLGTQLNLNTDTVGGIKIGLPPKKEQAEIIEFLHSKMSKVDAMCGTVQKAIEKLNEYRTALITAAVTGKIDVRNVTIPAQGAA